MNNLNFTEKAWVAFQEAAIDKYDFTTCQRPDGSKYGSNGRCIKGSETSPASQDDKKGSSKSGGGGGGAAGEMKSLKSEVKKLGGEYEKLRKDKSPKAEARKKQIMSDVNKNMNKQKELQKKMDDAAKSQSPKAPRDSSPAGAQRRSNAAMNARG